VRLRLYLDTSVISAYVDERLPERQRATLEFWERLGSYDVAISELTLTEARATGDAALRQRMINLVDDFLILPGGKRPDGSLASTWAAVCSPQRQPWTRSTWRLRLPPARICS